MHLRRRLGQDRVVLVAHSQGTVIGTGMARRRPDLIHTYVGLGQMVDMPRNESIVYQRLLTRALRKGKRDRRPRVWVCRYAQNGRTRSRPPAARQDPDLTDQPRPPTPTVSAI